MALVLQDRVREVSYSTGTGAVTLAGAYTGYRTFSSCVPTGSLTYYCITNGQAGFEGEWEVGYGTYTTSTNELSRDNVYDSSNAGALVNFSNPATLTVFITQPADQAIYQETNGDLRLVGGVIGLSEDGTQGTTLPNTSFQAFTTGDYYMQANQQNLDSGSSASSDWVSTADNGSDTENYIDMGMASSGYNYPDFGAQDPNSGYVISTGSNLQLVAGKYGANVAAANASATDIIFVAGDLLKSGVRGTVKGDTGNWILGPYGTTDSGEKVQVVGDGAFTGDVGVGGTVTVGANPTMALEVATKAYVDQQTSTGIHIHTPCASETSAALSAVYTQGGTTFNITDITGTNTVVTSTTHGLSINDEIWLYSTAGNGLSTNTAYFVYATPTTTSLQLSASYGGPLLTGLTNASGLSYATRANSGVGAYLEASANQALPIAGVSVSDRVLVYQQATGYWDGVYTVTALGAADPGGSKWKLTRATDANKYEPDNTQGLGAGDYFFIQSNSESYVLTDPTGPVIIGYDAITYTLFSSVPAYTGTSPINITGTTISLDTVPVANGGTNLTSYTSGDILYATGSTTLSKRGIGSNGNLLIVSGGVPSWGTVDLSSANAVTSTLGQDHGGTGFSTYTLGDLLYSSATNTLSKLPGQTTTTKKYLSQTGDGVDSAAPAWAQVAAADISGLAPSATTDTTNASNITSGTLPTGRLTGSYTGVTGVGTLTAGTWTANVIGATYGGTGVAGTITGLAYANGTSAYTEATAAQVVAVIGSTAVANATYAVSSNSSTYTTNIIGGAAGSIPYQTALNTTGLLATGSGVLVGGTTPAWSTAPTLTGTNFSSIPNSATTATAANTPSAIVARDAGGNFTAGTITANLTGTASSATTAVNVAAANLTGTTLSSNVTTSSMTGVGTLTAGTWTANVIGATYGGTGVAGTITGIPYANGIGAYTAATAAQIVAAIGTTAVANATYATTAGSSGSATNVAAANLTGTTLSSNVTSSSLTTVGNVTSGTWSATIGAVSGANLSTLNASNLSSGTIPSAILGNSTAYVGTTAVALNRASANQAMTGISSVTMPGSTSGTIQVIPAATAGTGTVFTIPATTGTAITSGDTGTVTNTMLAGSIANAKLANSSITINSQAISLGGSGTITANTTSSLTFNNGGAGGVSGSTFNGSGALTVSYNTIGASPTAGSTSITSVGTLTAGTWNANAIATSYGGTGTAGTLTGLAYGNGASAMSAATAAQVVAVIGSTAVANATYATSAGSATTATTAINQSGGTVSATSITTSGAITANGNSNYYYQYAHGNYTVQMLPAANNGASTGDAGLYSWISEPAITWTGAGIARNRRNNGTGATGFARVNTSLTGQMIRFGEGTDFYFTSLDTSDVAYSPLSLSGNNATVAGTLTAASLGGGAATGTGASGTWNINITGSAGSATPADNSITRAKMYKGSNDGTAVLCGADGAIFLNPNTINNSTTIPANYNGVSAGPITIATGVTVTVSTGATWVIA